MNAGGIVGYADSLYVYLCTNKSQVKGGTHSHKPDRLSGFMGTGGIVGGSGISSIITCRNEGSVNGQRGVGGIIGSTLVILNPATYNNTFIGYCSNKGRVNGKENVGGLCGEAQLGTHNRGYPIIQYHQHDQFRNCICLTVQWRHERTNTKRIIGVKCEYGQDLGEYIYRRDGRYRRRLPIHELLR